GARRPRRARAPTVRCGRLGGTPGWSEDPRRGTARTRPVPGRPRRLPGRTGAARQLLVPDGVDDPGPVAPAAHGRAGLRSGPHAVRRAAVVSAVVSPGRPGSRRPTWWTARPPRPCRSRR